MQTPLFTTNFTDIDNLDAKNHHFSLVYEENFRDEIYDFTRAYTYTCTTFIGKREVPYHTYSGAICTLIYYWLTTEKPPLCNC
jgi:hypothetical protein